jgi:hypothetical protein
MMIESEEPAEITVNINKVSRGNSLPPIDPKHKENIKSEKVAANVECEMVVVSSNANKT